MLLTCSDAAKKYDVPFSLPAICYVGRWFWIDNTDFRSNRIMSYVPVLLALSDSGAKGESPSDHHPGELMH